MKGCGPCLLISMLRSRLINLTFSEAEEHDARHYIEQATSEEDDRPRVPGFLNLFILRFDH